MGQSDKRGKLKMAASSSFPSTEPTNRRPGAPREQTRVRARTPIGLPPRSHDGHDQADPASASAPPVALYIDRQPLWRDCVSERLASCLPEWLVEPVASIREVQSDENW